VKSITIVLPLPGAPIRRCSTTEDPELFKATLCGLGATGLILEIEIEVEDAFRLRETKEGRSVDEVIDSLDVIKHSAEHVRVWWYPDGKGMILGRANRTYVVRTRWSSSHLGAQRQSRLHASLSGISCNTAIPLRCPFHSFSHFPRRSMGMVVEQYVE
jgi:hypothetical protein